MDRTPFFRIFDAVREGAGIPPEKRFPHIAKHSLASHLVAGNVNLALVKLLILRCPRGSTMVYVGTTDAQAAEAGFLSMTNQWTQRRLEAESQKIVAMESRR